MSDYETAQRKRDIIVGIFVVVAFCALVWLIFKFQDFPTAFSEKFGFSVIVQFATAPGIQKDTPVNFCGYRIGIVTHVMAPHVWPDLNTGLEYHQTRVILSIKEKYKNIPSNVEVKLMRRGLGSSFIELVVDPCALPAPPRDPNRPETSFLVDGTLLQGSTGVTSEFFPEESQKKLDKLVEGLNQLIENANDIIGDPNNKEDIRTTLANLPGMTEQAEQMCKEFRELAAAATTTLSSADAKAEKLVVAMVDTSEELSKTMAELRVILEKVNTGKGTAAKIINDPRLYDSMLENAEQMRKLMEEAESFVVELKAFIAKARKKGLKVKPF